MTRLNPLPAVVLLLALVLSASRKASAFPHTLASGETLALLSKRYYGTPQLERILVTANGLDRGGPRSLTPGMILEIPSHSYSRVGEGETWPSLAQKFLGHAGRATTLAHQNDSEPWLIPEIGRIIRLPYNLSWVLTGDESLATLAYRFLGTTKRAYELAEYNQLKDAKLKAGQVLLIPLRELSLTAEGELARAQSAGPEGQVESEQLRKTQTKAQSELAELHLDIRGGRYARALGRVYELHARGGLTRPRQIELRRLEIEVHVAFESQGAARAACGALRELAPEFRFDPVETSPKILALCPNP